MLSAYNILTYIVDFHLGLIALFNKKIRLGVRGRNESFSKLEKHLEKDDSTLWFHCASLGEYEQGLPVFEQLKLMYPEHKVVLSFFSPSGYEYKKDSPVADIVIYLPLDTRRNARRFVKLVKPELVIFVKYEIWPNYLFELQKNACRALLISALFRPGQNYFKRSGRWMLKAMKTFEWIFVQNEESEELLSKHGVTNVSLSGDTRFDRVDAQLSKDNSIEFIDRFKGDSLCIVAGSTWPEGEAGLVQFINSDTTNSKLIIAPHNIKESRITKLEQSIDQPVIRFTQARDKDLSAFKVLILDTIGMLSRIYAYGDISYVGGAMGTTGLHNTLEAAVFGMPILIGPNHERFPEAKAMIKAGGMFVVENAEEMGHQFQKLISDESFRLTAGVKNRSFIEKSTGAVVRILDYLRK